MANRDIVVLNTTQSRAETQQGSDTVRIKGIGKVLSVDNSSNLEVLSFQSDDSQTTLSGSITYTGDISGGLASSASFGKVEATTLIGSAFELTDTDLPFTLSASSQIASLITGSFRAGFEFDGEISGSGGSTGSFDRIIATTFAGDANDLGKSSELPNTVSASSTIAADISGSFNKGFEFVGTISGSATSTGSFAQVVATTLVGSAVNLTNSDKTNTISSSAQIASRISGSFNKGFEFDGEISASISGSVSLKTLTANTLVGDGSELTNTISTGTVTGSAQLASAISGAFNAGFEVGGNISGSMTSTGSFGNVIAREFVGSGVNITNVPLPTGTVSSSAQLASRISGSWSNGFQYKDNLQISFGNWSVGGALNQIRCHAGGFGTKAGFVVAGGSTGYNPTGNPYGTISCVESYNGSSFSEVANLNLEREKVMAAGTTTAGIVFGGSRFANQACGHTEKYNGASDTWSEVADMNTGAKGSGEAGDTSEAVIAFGGEIATTAHYGAPSFPAGNAEEYNGAVDSWSEISSLNCYRTRLAGFGNSEAALAVAGLPTPGGHMPGNAFDVEEWNGSNWTHIGSTLTHHSETYLHSDIKGAGTVNDGHAFGGCHLFPQAPTTCFDARSQHWDGTSWCYGGRLLTGRGAIAGDGTNGGNAIVAGGNMGASPYTSTCTEEYNPFFVTASFGTVITNRISGEACTLDNVSFPAGTVTSSAQVADSISGSFEGGFDFTGEIRTAKGVWSAGGALNTARTTMREAGTQNAALAMGGSSPSKVGISEEYNGSTWSEGNDMITARAGGMGAGTQNAALVAFGNDPSGPTKCTEEYNGTTYCTGGAGILARHSMSGVGTQTAALAISGYAPNSSNLKSETELYDGNAFSEVADVIDARGNHASAGTQNSAIFMAGSKGAGTLRKNTEFWDGSSWSQVADLVMPQGNLIGNISGGGTSNSAWIAGGEAPSPTGYVTSTEHWDGISWSVDGNLITARQRLGGAGDQKSALVFGGNDGSGVLANTEEYASYYSTGSFGRVEAHDVQIAGDSQLVVSASLQIPVFPSNGGIVSSSAGQMWFNSTTNKLNFTMDVNSWSAGGNMNSARHYVAGTGTQNAALAVGGEDASAVKVETELYNGSTWSESGGDLTIARAMAAATGTQTSALVFGGYVGTATPVEKNETESFNGTAFDELATMNKTRRLHYGLGTQNAALAAGGKTSTPSAAIVANSEEWNGTSWYAAADLNASKGFGAAGGTQNAGIIFGGSVNLGVSSPNVANGQTETYDGTSWTERNDMVFARQALAGNGTQNAAVVFGGQNAPAGGGVELSCTEEWNGTSWSVVNAMGTGRRNVGGGGSQSSAIVFAGAVAASPYYQVATEEYSVSALKTVEIDGV